GRKLVRAVLLGEIRVKAEAVRVRRKATGPIDEAAVDAIERLETLRACRLTDNRPEIARMHAPFARQSAFFVGRQPLDLPDGQIEIRERHVDASEDATDDARPSFRSIEMHDVRELVREDKPQPVLGVSDE